MGALSSIATGLSGIASVVNTVNSLATNINSLAGNPQKEARRDLQAEQNLALNQLKAQQDLEQKNAAAQAALQKAQMTEEASADDAQRRAALRRAVARQRASFGSQGIGSADGSAEAVLLGLFDESDEDRQTRERLDTLRATALDQSLGARSSVNILERTQLQERQKLERELLS